MGAPESTGQLAKATRDLLTLWQETKRSWDDAQSRRFEATTLLPLQGDVKAAIGGIDQMGKLLADIRRACGQ